MTKRAEEIKEKLLPYVEGAIERGFLVSPTGPHMTSICADGTICLKGAMSLGLGDDLADLDYQDLRMFKSPALAERVSRDLGITCEELAAVERGFEGFPIAATFHNVSSEHEELYQLGTWFRETYFETK